MRFNNNCVNINTAQSRVSELYSVHFQEIIKGSKIHKQILKLDPMVIAQEFTRIVRLLYYHTLEYSMNCTYHSQQNSTFKILCSNYGRCCISAWSHLVTWVAKVHCNKIKHNIATVQCFTCHQLLSEFIAGITDNKHHVDLLLMIFLFSGQDDVNAWPLFEAIW